MNIAILLTGQLRTFNMVKYLHMNSLILKYNADIFLGIDLSNTFQTESNKNSINKTNMENINDAIQYFNPVDTFILDDFTEEFNNITTNSINNFNYHNIVHFEGMLRQYYVVKNTYKMLINNNKKYDLILRLRFDQFIFSDDVPIAPELYDSTLNTILYNEKNTNILKNYTIDKKFIFDELHDNDIYVLGFGDYKHYKYVNDQFFYHNNSILIKMFEFYDNIVPLLKHCDENNIGNLGAIYECIFYIYLTKNNINFKKGNISGIFIREYN